MISGTEMRVLSDQSCPPGVRVANCLFNPCDAVGVSCAGHPDAVCRYTHENYPLTRASIRHLTWVGSETSLVGHFDVTFFPLFTSILISF